MESIDLQGVFDGKYRLTGFLMGYLGLKRVFDVMYRFTGSV